MREAFEKAGFRASEPPPLPGGSGFALKRNYAAQADETIQVLKNTLGRDYNNFTTSKIRNILAMVSEIYNEVRTEHEEVLSPELQGRIEYLKVRLAYESGREPRTIKQFVSKAGLMELLDAIGGNRQRFIDFARYMEALVAYHRFHGGKD